MVGPNFLGMSLFLSVPILHSLHLLPSLPAACCLPGWADSSPPTSMPAFGSSHTWPPACCRDWSSSNPQPLALILPESSAWLATPHSQSRSPHTKHTPLISLLVELKVQLLTQSYPRVWWDKAGQPLRGLEGNQLSPHHQGTPRAGVWLSTNTRPWPPDCGESGSLARFT